MAKNKIKYLKGDKSGIEGGYLDYFFGYGNKSSRNIIGLICLVLTFGVLGIAFLGNEDKKDILGILVPLLTFVLGYFIGSKNQ